MKTGHIYGNKFSSNYKAIRRKLLSVPMNITYISLCAYDYQLTLLLWLSFEPSQIYHRNDPDQLFIFFDKKLFTRCDM